MKLVAFSTDDGIVHPGALLEETNLVVDLSATGYADTLAVIAAGITTISPNSDVCLTHRFSDVTLHAPLSNPPRVFAIGLNYRDHAIESGMAIPTTPVVFFNSPPPSSALASPSSFPKTPPSPTTKPS